MNHAILRLAFNFHDVFNIQEQAFKAIKAIKDGSEGDNVQKQYSVFRRSSQATELIFFHGYKGAIEVDEFGHSTKSINH